jgi:hypothetical protein
MASPTIQKRNPMEQRHHLGLEKELEFNRTKKKIGIQSNTEGRHKLGLGKKSW